MSIDKIIETVEATIDGRVVSKRYTQIVDADTGQVHSSKLLLENIEIDDPENEPKVAALSLRLVGSLAVQQEGIVRGHEAQKLTDDETIANERSQKDVKAAECVAHEATIAKLRSEIVELKKVPVIPDA